MVFSFGVQSFFESSLSLLEIYWFWGFLFQCLNPLPTRAKYTQQLARPFSAMGVHLSRQLKRLDFWWFHLSKDEWPHTGCVHQSFGRQGVKWFLDISVNCKSLGLNKLFKGLFRFPHLILLPVFFFLFPVFSALVPLYSFSFGEVWKPITLTQGLKIVPACPGKSCCI